MYDIDACGTIDADGKVTVKFGAAGNVTVTFDLVTRTQTLRSARRRYSVGDGPALHRRSSARRRQLEHVGDLRDRGRGRKHRAAEVSATDRTPTPGRPAPWSNVVIVPCALCAGVAVGAGVGVGVEPPPGGVTEPPPPPPPQAASASAAEKSKGRPNRPVDHAHAFHIMECRLQPEHHVRDAARSG